MDVRQRHVGWYLFAFILFSLWCLSDPAKADTYLTASIGRSEFPMKAWDQVQMPNSEDNQPMMYALGLGYRYRWAALEVTYYDFGKMAASGYYAKENGPGDLNYDKYSFKEVEGYVKGPAISLLAHYRVLFARAGMIRAQTKMAIRKLPKDGEPRYLYDDTYTRSEPIFGLGIERNDVRIEYVQTDVQPHGDAAFGKVRAVMMTVKF